MIAIRNRSRQVIHISLLTELDFILFANSTEMSPRWGLPAPADRPQPFHRLHFSPRCVRRAAL